jgi:mono/diheme cytochrome c family protein
VSGQVGILIALVALTIMLAGVFLVRPSFTLGATGKILAFVALCILPALCIGTGMSFHMQRSQQTAYCVSCHSMESHGQSLYVLNASYIPAQHFQNHLVSPDKACYGCHTDYTMYGPLKDKIKGLGYLYMEYVSTPPKTIHLDGTYSNLQCLHCHTGMRSFDENPTHTAIMGSLKTNQISCISCHNMIHNASEVSHMKMWVDGDAPTPNVAAAAPATHAAPAGAAKAPAGHSASAATAALGKSIFESQGCGGCHGESGRGGSGPALTQTSSQYPPAQLTAVLKTPTPQMKAAGMVPLSLNAADMKSLVSYVDSIEGPSASPARPTSTAKAQPGSAPGPPNAVSAALPPSVGSPAPATAESPAAAGPAGNSAGAATAEGKNIFESQGCGGCHGESGGGGSGPALTHTSSQYPPAQLTAILKTPTPAMKAAGMVALSVNSADMEALVSYVSSLGGTPAASAATPPAPGSSSSAPSAAKAATTAASSKAPTGTSAVDATAVRGKSIFDSQGCSGCHGETGGGGTGPALFHLPSQYSPAQIAAVRKGVTAVLKAPTTKMKAAGMVPLTLNVADMDDLVSYVSSPGGTSAAPAAAPPAPGSAAPATAGPVVAAAPSKPESKGRAILGWISVFLPYPHGTPPTGEPAAATGPSVAGSSADAARGKTIFASQGCGGCHGESGSGGSGPALTQTSSQYPPAQLTVILKTPTAAMKAAGMVPLSLNAADMKSLVSYVTSLGGTSVVSAAPVSAATTNPQ